MSYFEPDKRVPATRMSPDERKIWIIAAAVAVVFVTLFVEGC